MHTVYLSLGSNIDPEENLPKAVALLRQHLQVLAVSSAWETPAVGCCGPDYLNAALSALTSWPDPDRLKREVLRPIETQLGRVRSADRNAPRPIDLDVILFDGQLLDDELWCQAYLAVPMSELDPDYLQADTHETLAQAAARLRSGVKITHRPEILSLVHKPLG